MKKLRLILVLLAVVGWVQAANVTTLVMNVDVGNGVVAMAGPSRVRVPPGEWVNLTVSSSFAGSIQWRKNGVVIPGATQTTLTLPSASAGDTGDYTVTGLPSPLLSSGIRLEVVNPGTTSNFSSRLLLQPGDDSQIIGFVVSGKTTKSVLIRAVGPTLASFAVPKPAAQPRMTVYDATGQAYSWVRLAVVQPPEYWTALFASVGAFALTGGEPPYLSYDVVPLPPGAYSVVVRDAAKLGGTVLVEVYDLPGG